jgi:hypothetical protein
MMEECRYLKRNPRKCTAILKTGLFGKSNDANQCRIYTFAQCSIYDAAMQCN